MVELTLERIFLGPEYTIGKLYINGEYFCDTLEDTNRDINKDGDLNDVGEGKVYGNTCIPFGKYKVELSHSVRFGRILPAILDVPHFTGIRIHRGNTHFDTHGCILVGINNAKGRVAFSTQYEKSLIAKLSGKADITIEIK
jgi:hypothetical protein